MAESASDQIERLGQFIMDEIPGEPSQSQGAVDTAIRLLGGAETNTWEHLCPFSCGWKRRGSGLMTRADLEAFEKEAEGHLDAVHPGWTYATERAERMSAGSA